MEEVFLNGQSHIYTYVYVLSILSAIVISLTVYLKINTTLGKEREIRYFKNMVFSFLLFQVFDVFWILTGINSFNFPDIVTTIISIAKFASISITAYFSYLYSESRLSYESLDSKMFRLLSLIPLLIVILIYIVNIDTGFVFVVESGKMANTVYYPIKVSLDSIYLLVPIFHGTFLYFKSRTKTMKKARFTVIYFNFFPFMFSVSDTFIYYTPNISVGFILSMLIIFIDLQDSMIFTDSLTGLNNRRRFEIYLDELKQNSQYSQYSICMLDVNNFKKINDTMGHTEGDKALMVVSKTIKDVSDLYNLFSARWAGDEFLFVGKSVKFENKEDFVYRFNSLLERNCREENLKYTLSVCVGFSDIYNSRETVEEIVTRTDKELYKCKKDYTFSK